MSVSRYFQESRSKWIDPVLHKGMHWRLDDVASIDYYWSTTFKEHNNDFEGSQIKLALDNVGINNTRLMVISGHIVHLWSKHFARISASLVGKKVDEVIVQPFLRDDILGEIMKKLNQYDDLVIMVLSTFHPITFKKKYVEKQWNFFEAYGLLENETTLIQKYMTKCIKQYA